MLTDKTIQLITGIPRSGTTLCCKILNSLSNTVALHEPIDPHSIKPDETKDILSTINDNILKLQSDIYSGQAFEHGDTSGLNVSNPVSDQYDIKSGKRITVAKRGKIMLSSYKNKDIQLVVKQNALFTAYLRVLSARFNTVCIVRNPVDVFLSWWTVNLPVNKGRLPAGENNCPHLKQMLMNEQDIVNRQVMIYEWFCTNYAQASLVNVLKYEDIISSDGAVLCNNLKLDYRSLAPLTAQDRKFSEHTLKTLEKNAHTLIALNTHGFYSKQQIESKLAYYLSDT